MDGESTELSPPGAMRLTISLFLSLLISLHGLRKKSLDITGGVAAIFVGFILTTANGCFCAALLTFFLTSSRLTKWRAKEKRKIEEDYKEGRLDVYMYVCDYTNMKIKYV